MLHDYNTGVSLTWESTEQCSLNQNSLLILTMRSFCFLWMKTEKCLLMLIWTVCSNYTVVTMNCWFLLCCCFCIFGYWHFHVQHCLEKNWKKYINYSLSGTGQYWLFIINKVCILKVALARMLHDFSYVFLILVLHITVVYCCVCFITFEFCPALSPYTYNNVCTTRELEDEHAALTLSDQCQSPAASLAVEPRM